MKDRLSYLLFAVFLGMIVIAIACSDDKSEGSIEVSTPEEKLEVAVEEVKQT